MILVFVEIEGGSIKKSSQEALTYGADLATATGDTCSAIAIGDASAVGNLIRLHQKDIAMPLTK